MKVGSSDTGERVIVVAEIGNNHEGNVSVAHRLVEQAAEAGADAVKFQTFNTEHFVSRSDAERFARLEGFRLGAAAFAELAEAARRHGLLFLSTPLDLASADLLEPLVDAFKVASGDNTFVPLLRRIAGMGKPVVVSAGLTEIDQIAETVEILRSTPGFGGEAAVLHCVSAYPVLPEHASLRAIEALRDRLDCTVGYSDHTIGLEAAVASVALGARIVEKHFTLDKHFSDFRDHQLSADPPELARLVERIRALEVLLGPTGKHVQPSEAGGVTAFRRSIVAARDLRLGQRLEPADLTWVRPGGGLAPGQEDVLVGRTLVRDVPEGDRLTAADVA